VKESHGSLCPHTGFCTGSFLRVNSLKVCKVKEAMLGLFSFRCHPCYILHKSSPYHSFHFQFHYLKSMSVQKYLNGKFQRFKLHIVLDRMRNLTLSHTILLHPAWDMNHPFAQCIHVVYLTHPLVTVSVIQSIVVVLQGLCSSGLCFINKGPKVQE
jgi:hypothetical protein